MEVLEKNMIKRESFTGIEPIIQIEHLSKSFGSLDVLKDFNLTITSGENVVVMGKSGIGKTVLIKCLIGLIKPDSGVIHVFGKDISTLNHEQLDDMRMRIGFVFQSSALYDSMTVRQNLELPLRRQRSAKLPGSLNDLVIEALRNVGLESSIDMMPSELSGGMRKRIGIARSIILKPEIVMYDEPTTGLDPITSTEITNLIMDLQEKYHTTGIIITHDIKLAKAVSNRLIFLVNGIAYKQGTYDELQKLNDPNIKPFFE